MAVLKCLVVDGYRPVPLPHTLCLGCVLMEGVGAGIAT
jgi:hypothetical protein